MKIANIVSTTNINVSNDFNVVKSLGEIIQGLPTLIIGWDFVKKNYPDYDILTKKLEENLYWTFKKTEDRSKHEEDIYNFVENTYRNLINGIEYVYVDPILFSRRKIKKIITKIKGLKEIISYEHKGMIYIYGEKLIFGVDLSILEYMGFNTCKVKNKIITISNIFLTYDTIFIEYKKKVENLDNQIRFLPYLYSIDNG